MTQVFALKDRGVSELLASYFGREVSLAKTASGAPYIENESTCISLSHKDRILVVALSDKSVGVDIESIVSKDSHIKIAARYFTSNEMDYINSEERFFRLWTRKEALGKLLGVGLNSETIAVDVIKNHATFNGQKYYLDTNTELLEGYCISVASLENITDYYIGIDEMKKMCYIKN